MRIRPLTLAAALGLLASGAAGAAATSTSAGASAAPAAPPASGSFSGGGGGGARSGGGGGRWMGGGRGGYGAVGRGTGIPAGATEARALALAHSGRAAGYDFIVSGRTAAAPHGSPDVQARLAWAPGTASAAHAVRVVDSFERSPGRAVRQVHQVRPVRRDELDSLLHANNCVLKAGTVVCPVLSPLRELATEYCGNGYTAPCVGMPQGICVEPDSPRHFRYFDCAQPLKMGAVLN